jgi:hypothetical protein
VSLVITTGSALITVYKKGGGRMSPKDIQAGKVYRNRGKGRTTRTVLNIGNEYRPTSWFSDSDPPDEPGVYYVDSSGRHNRLYLSSFAQWCGEEVK